MRFKKTTVSAIIILVALATIVVMSGLNFIFPSETRRVADLDKDIIEADKHGYKTMEKIYFITKDGVKIVADLYSVSNPIGWLVLSHMMPATKESYSDLAQRLQNLGYESLAIDLRGHGESDGGPNGFTQFSDSEHQKSIFDLEASVDYLIKNRGAVAEKISFIGASIGANLSLQYISEHPEYKTAILLSAGLNYKGIKTEPMVKKLKVGQKILFVGAKDDERSGGNNVEMNQKLYDLTPAGIEKKIQIYDSGGHGTDILKNQPELMNLIIQFLQLN